MIHFSHAVVTAFCEDIREEVGGQISLVGILPDNMAVPALPGMLPKLGVYTRAIFSADIPITSDMALIITGSDGADIGRNVFTATEMEASRQTSLAQNSPTMTMISRMMLSPFPIASTGRISVVADYQGTRTLTGFLNVVVGGPATD